MLKPGLADDYDVLFRFDMAAEFTPEQRQAFLDLLNTGAGIGFVPFHHNLAAHRPWDEWRKIIGGKYLFADEIIDGQQFRQTVSSGIQAPLEQNIQVVDRNHEITRGVSDFTIQDEIYNNIYLSKDIHVLLTSDHPDGEQRLVHDGGRSPAMSWTKTSGASRVFEMRLGHHREALENPSFRKLMSQGLRWAACGSKKQFCTGLDSND